MPTAYLRREAPEQPVDELLAIGSDGGAASLGLSEWSPVRVDATHPQLRGVDEPRAALVHGCSADVFSS